MSANVAPASYTIHPVHYDEGNVHFITTDNVLFSFQLGRLATVSSFFKDLGDIPQPPGRAPHQRKDISNRINNIPLIFPECTSHVLEAWLALVSLANDKRKMKTGTKKRSTLHLPLEQCDQLYTLNDKYGCDPAVLECLREQLLLMEKDFPMRLVGFAAKSEVDDQVLGTRALGRTRTMGEFYLGHRSYSDYLSLT
ncbi:hypothetical protein IAR50_007327 [Cryptococcus sp. DSM 104548]